MKVGTCAKCSETKSLDMFHRQGEGRRHAWCKACYNAWNRARRKRRSKSYWRERNFVQRYGMTKNDTEIMLHEQGGCAICGRDPERPCVDHCHETGRVRGILCHRCNTLLAGVDDAEFLARALAYLGKS